MYFAQLNASASLVLCPFKETFTLVKDHSFCALLGSSVMYVVYLILIPPYQQPPLEGSPFGGP
jgi:hypothetical protein